MVVWIFEQYKAGKSLGKIAAGLEQQGILSPTGKRKWNREAIDEMFETVQQEKLHRSKASETRFL